jgi:hypothetical protein
MSENTTPPEMTKEQPNEQLLALVAIGKHLHTLAENSQGTAKDLKEINALLNNISAVLTLGLVVLVLFLVFLSVFLARSS